MIIEYIGTGRFAGSGTVHDVRAFWNANREEQGDVKRAAVAAVRRVVGKGGTVAFESWDLDTYKTPTLAAIIHVRYRTAEQVATRKELKTRRYTGCDGCTEGKPSHLVSMHADKREQAFCYECWNANKGDCKVLHWIRADGSLQIN